MSLLNDASLILVPSAIKTGEVLVQKPLPNKFADETGNYDGNDPQGSANLTFTRASSATRVGPDGLIEKVRTNLALYSEQFDNANWIKLASSVTANAGTAPDGTTTADKIIPNTSNTNHLVYSNVITSAGEYSFSVYVKASGYSKVALRESQSVGFFASFDLTSETILDSSTDQNNTITSVGDGWFRITSTRSYSGGITLGLIPLEDSYTSGSPFTAYAGDGTSGIFAWGAQMEFNVPTQYIGPTTTAAVSVGPVSGLPRLDYSGGSSCGKLLLEPQRTNLLLYSEQMDNWGQSRGTITSNAIASPDGYTNADLWAQNTGETTAAALLQNISVTSGTAYSLSVFAKKQNKNFLGIRANSVSSTPSYFDLENGTLGNINPLHTAKIEDYGNGWHRCSISYTTNSTSAGHIFYPTDGSSLTVTDSGGIYLFGAMHEAGSYSTSYINTLNSAVTRLADACSKTGISSLIGQTEGTLFAEFVHNGADILTTQSVISVNSGNTTNFVNIGVYDGRLNPAVRGSGTNIFDLFVGPNPLPAGTHKIALAYKSNDFAIYLNGSLIYTSTSAATFSLSQLDLGTFLNFNTQLGDGINQALLFKTRLSNSDLATLTQV